MYQILENVDQGGTTITRQSTSGPMAEAIAREMPEVIHAVTTTTNRIGDYILSVEDNDVKTRGLFADPDFFNMFSFEVIQGNQTQVLNDKNSVVISENLALKLYGSTDNAVGKMVEWQHLKQYRISGVFRDISPRSSLQFDFVSTFESFKDDFPSVTSWGNSGPSTFVLLKENTDIARFNEKIADYVKVKTNGQSDHRSPFAAKFSDTYLYNQYENGVQAGGRIEYVKLFSLIALFILFIACINFMNLSTARASGRIKELGVKKAIGAQRGTLVLQYLGESTFMALISLVVAILLVTLLLPQFNVLTEKQLTLNFNLGFILTLLSIVLATGLIAGSYPALYISGLNSIAVLKGGKLSSH
ncbi:ABC-type antimicrobial peptide transport system permease subunit, partial [Algoriphagus sp. 4150]|nr:ABC-type antimicrobial peptide transport system permease subunit [Algoriphagus sp. 4150]